MTDLVMSLLDPSNSGEACKRLVLDAADKIADLQVRLAECKRANASLHESYMRIRNSLDAWRTPHAPTAEQVHSHVETCARVIREERDTLRAQLAGTQKLLEAQLAVGDKLTAEVARLTEQRHHAHAECPQCYAWVEAQEKEIAELQVRLAECKRERDEAQEYISVCDDSFIEVCNERDTLRAQLTETQKLLDAQLAVGDKLTAEVARLKNANEDLRDALGR